MKLSLYKRWTDSRKKAILDLLEYDEKAKVVDLGCGNGESSLFYKRKIGCSEILGLDIVDEILKRLKRKMS